MVANLAENYLITETEYLAGEKVSDVKHEYIEGELYAMAGASRNHERISGNIFARFLQHLDNTPCEPFTSDLKVKANGNFYYPDVLVTCDDENGDDYYTDSPILIVEVLSKSTRRRDKLTKMNAYRTIPKLEEYVLIEQDFVDIEVCRRKNNWVSEHYFLGDEVTFQSLELTLSVEAIYQRVQNEEMQEYLQKLAAK